MAISLIGSMTPHIGMIVPTLTICEILFHRLLYPLDGPVNFHGSALEAEHQILSRRTEMKFKHFFIPDDVLHLDSFSPLCFLIQTLSPLEESHDGILRPALLSTKSSVTRPKPRL